MAVEKSYPVVKLFVGLSKFNCIHEIDYLRFVDNMKDLKEKKEYSELLKPYVFDQETLNSLEIEGEVEELIDQQQIINFGGNFLYLNMEQQYLDKLLEDIPIDVRSLMFALINDYVLMNIDKSNKEFEEKHHIPAGPVLRKESFMVKKSCN